MTKFLALNISTSADGFMAGPNQTLESPLGRGGEQLHKWVFGTQSFREWHGEKGGETGLDNDYIARGFTNIGATIMGRNMFGPVRGEWPNEDWKGWWGPNPGYRHEVFVLTHYPRNTLDMGNGTKFHFITSGIDEASERAVKAAAGRDIRVGGGAQTIQQFLSAALLDELHIARVAVNLGGGELLISDPDVQLKHYRKMSEVPSDAVTHETYLKV